MTTLSFQWIFKVRFSCPQNKFVSATSFLIGDHNECLFRTLKLGASVSFSNMWRTRGFHSNQSCNCSTKLWAMHRFWQNRWAHVQPRRWFNWRTLRSWSLQNFMTKMPKIFADEKINQLKFRKTISSLQDKTKNSLPLQYIKLKRQNCISKIILEKLPASLRFYSMAPWQEIQKRYFLYCRVKLLNSTID